METNLSNGFYLILTAAAITATANLFTMYGIVMKKWVAIPKYKTILLIMLTSSLCHKIFGILYFFEPQRNVWLWINWLLGLSGVLALHCLAIAQLELLALFSPIAPYWTPRLIKKIKWINVCVHIIANIPVYIYPVRVFELISVEFRVIIFEVL
jgi:hypothetical protein